TAHTLDGKRLKEVYQQINAHLKVLKEQHCHLRGEILDFARTHAQDLGILHLFADRDSVTDKQIIEKIFDLYRYGQIGRLEDDELQIRFAELITESILITTEKQQYQHGKEYCKSLAAIWKQVEKRVPSSCPGKHKAAVTQGLANGSADWLQKSIYLKRFLEEGANHLRYTKTVNIDGKERYFLKDQKFTRRYLVSDVRNHWISRDKAIKSLQAMMKDLRDNEKKGEPVRFIKAKMGTGKSEFIFPEAIDLLIQEKREPIMVTTDDLVDQLQKSMDGKTFLFKFSIEFGLDKIHEDALASLDEERRREKWKELLKFENIEMHLKNLGETLDKLKGERKAVLTSPSQIAALRDKRVQLQMILTMLNAGEERSSIFRQLQLVKHIEGHFKKEGVVYLVDEDINYDISFEFNFATGEYRTVDPIRFDIAELLIRTIEKSHKTLWSKMVSNDLRSIQDIKVEFQQVAGIIFDNAAFWEKCGWKREDWKRINKEEFIEFVFGTRETPPSGMPEWDLVTVDKDGNPDLKKREANNRGKPYVAALKTFLTNTLDSVRGTHPKLERGISSANGVTTVPLSEGTEKVDVLYGEESENIFHHIFHYVGAGNMIGEEIFMQKYKDRKGVDEPMSLLYTKDTWQKWGAKISAIYNDKSRGHTSEHAAFINDPELAHERFLFLRHLMLDTDFVRVYLEQITFNSQDLGIGADVRVGSGTGQPFALNLANYEDKKPSPDVVLGETLLCLNLKERTTTFERVEGRAGTALEHI
ncbi:MAG TPA: hypothetical protein VIH61_04320, partial [Waddliaceae bacterium]